MTKTLEKLGYEKKGRHFEKKAIIDNSKYKIKIKMRKRLEITIDSNELVPDLTRLGYLWTVIKNDLRQMK